MQLIAHCNKKLCDSSHFEPKYALAEIRKSFGNRRQSRIPEQLAAGPSDVRITEAATAQKSGPKLGLLMLEPFYVGR